MKVLMICLGNICRSPLAHGILEAIIEEKKLDWTVDSCGTSGFHNGEAPDSRSVAVASSHNLDISRQQSRKLVKADIENFDLLIAMDSSNFQNIKALANEDQYAKIKLLLNYTYPDQNRAVPDPYYEGGFESVYQMIYKACHDLVEQELKNISLA